MKEISDKWEKLEGIFEENLEEIYKSREKYTKRRNHIRCLSIFWRKFKRNLQEIGRKYWKFKKLFKGNSEKTRRNILK